ncbi:di-heme oxidoredictase family protein [Celeribacter sp.]|uniref:di-heme oxidoreductase family protein n=1 Tax=Celeribacter sp. TaxID=1890673 RepID=UPI003A91E34F
MIRRPFVAPLATCLVLAQGAGAADDLTHDVHLSALERTAQEAARVIAITAPTQDFTTPEPFESNQGGAATVPARADEDAFSRPSATLTPDQELTFTLGRAMFKKLWVSSPSSTKASDGLGPLYNARSCLRCHVNNGRGHPPEQGGEASVSMFLRISVPAAPDVPMSEIEAYLAERDGEAATPVTRPDPTYGSQLQTFAIQGHAAEGRMAIQYEDISVSLAGGETVTLRAPTYSVEGAAYGALSPDALFSPRVANPMIGLGLLEAIPAADILAHADPDDADGDGISGRPQIVWSAAHERPVLGRFGWKAGNPTVEAQSAAAFSSDIGLSTPLAPNAAGDCTAMQQACVMAEHGDGDVRGTEVDQAGLDLVSFYAANLAVPARRDVDEPEVLRGKALFYESGCAACHVPKYVTARLEDAQDAPQSFQLIWPYTDLLLHDMGDGLADGRPEGRATGREWRTPPLWGIGLTAQVSGHTYLLHDGRARSVLEAVLWHGGEAQAARDAVVQMPKTDRDALLRFLESL